MNKDNVQVMYNNTTNTIMYQGDIEHFGCTHVKTLLLDIEAGMLANNTVKPIRLFINSPGGYFIEGMSLVDVIENLKVPVHTYATGYVASAAFKIFIAGDKRFTYKHSEFLFHNMSGGAHGSPNDIKAEHDMMLKEQDRIREYVKRRTKIPHNIVDDVLDNCKDLWFSAEEAIEYGIADVLIQ